MGTQQAINRPQIMGVLNFQKMHSLDFFIYSCKWWFCSLMFFEDTLFSYAFRELLFCQISRNSNERFLRKQFISFKTTSHIFLVNCARVGSN